MNWIYEQYGKEEVDFCENELTKRPIFWVPQFKALDLFVRDYERARRLLAMPDVLSGNLSTENAQWFVSRYLPAQPHGVNEIVRMNFALIDHSARVGEYLHEELRKRMQQRKNAVEAACYAITSRDYSALEQARSLLRDDTLDDEVKFLRGKPVEL